jgi:hypothetical protein
VLRDKFGFELAEGCSAEQARAFLTTNEDGIDRVTREPSLLCHVLQVLASNDDASLRAQLIMALSGWKAERLGPSHWASLLADADNLNRATAYRLAAEFGPEDDAMRGLVDPSLTARTKTLEGLIKRSRTVVGLAWKEQLKTLASSEDSTIATLALIAAAAHGFADIALNRISELDPVVLGNILKRVDRFIENALSTHLAAIVDVTLTERFAPFDNIAPHVITILAGSRIDTELRGRLQAFAVNHASGQVRAAAVALAKTSRNTDVVKFLLADSAAVVREAAWTYLLEADPGSVPIDPDALGRLILDERAHVDLRVKACCIASRHQVIEAVNPLKSIADSQLKARAHGVETLGGAARAALLILWPESGAWINSRLDEY